MVGATFYVHLMHVEFVRLKGTIDFADGDRFLHCQYRDGYPLRALWENAKTWGSRVEPESYAQNKI